MRNLGNTRAGIPPATPFWTPHQVRGDTICSFFLEPRLYPRCTLLDTASQRGITSPVSPNPMCRHCSRNHVYHIRSFFLGSEKNEPRSAAAVIGPRRSQTAPSSWAAELAALRQSSPSILLWFALSLPDKGGLPSGLHIFSHTRSSPSFFSPFSPIGWTALCIPRLLSIGYRVAARYDADGHPSLRCGGYMFCSIVCSPFQDSIEVSIK